MVSCRLALVALAALPLLPAADSAETVAPPASWEQARAEDPAWQQRRQMLAQDLISENPSVREQALRTIAAEGDRAKAGALLPFLDLGTPVPHLLIAIPTSAALGNQAAVTGIRQHLTHERAEVRGAALQALIDLKALTTEDLVARCADDDPALRQAALEQLALFPVPEGAALLGKGLTDHPQARVRRLCAHGLARLRDPQQAPFFLRALQDGDAGVRDQAAGALAALGHRPALPVLLTLLDSAVGSPAMAQAVDRLTGLHLGWQPNAPEAKRRAAIQQGWQWWNRQNSKR